MTRAFRAELVKLQRRRTIIATAIMAVAFAVGSAAIVVAAAVPAGSRPTGRGLTLEALAASGAGTRVFRTAASFSGFFVFVLFIGAMAVEFPRGTLRTMLLHEPRRVSLLAGKVAALLAFASGVIAGAEILTWVAARVAVSVRHVPTSQWLTIGALGHAATDLAAVVLWVSCYALLAVSLAVVARSLTVALAVGIAWAGPFEHLIENAWASAGRFFPGLLLEAFAAGGTPLVSATRALITVAAYAAAAATAASVLFARRDVTI